MYGHRDFDQDERFRMRTDISRSSETKQRELEQITDITRAQLPTDIQKNWNASNCSTAPTSAPATAKTSSSSGAIWNT